MISASPLFQRTNFTGCFQRLGFLKCFSEFVLMDCRPFDNKSPGAGWKLAVDKRKSLDIHHGFAAAVNSVKVRRWMIPKIHLDHNAVET